MIRTVLRWRGGTEKLGACLGIPFFDAAGNRVKGYSRLKPDNPLVGKNGQPRKYESPKGLENQVYIPPGGVTQASLADPAIPLLLTEGEKKSAACDQAGLPCVGLIGVEGWSRRRKKDSDGKSVGERELLPALAAIAWNGRQVFIAYDSDLSEKPEVQRAEHSLAQSLQKHGAIVRCIRLPAGLNGEKVGLDDYLLTHAAEDLCGLMAEAVQPKRPLVVNEDPNDPHRLARRFLDKWGKVPEFPPWRYWLDQWYRWRGSCYRLTPDNELRADLAAHIKRQLDEANLYALKCWDAGGCKGEPPSALKVTRSLISDVEVCLRSICILGADHEAPCWLGKNPPWSADETLVLQNGMVHLPSLVRGKTDAFRPHDVRLWTHHALPYAFDSSAPQPSAWLKLLGELWADAESRDALQEFIGFLLLQDTSIHTMLMLIGPPRSGKGTILRMLEMLIGKHNCVSTSLADLAGTFGLQKFMGKSVAFLSDARSDHRDIDVAVERILSITGGDSQNVNRKFRDEITTPLKTRFILAANQLPRLPDSSGAIATRPLVLRLRETWLGREDISLGSKLKAELPGILNWSIAGWHRLNARGRFLQPMSGKELLDHLEVMSSPVKAFVDDCCDVDQQRDVAKGDLYLAWQAWCERSGHHPGSESVFGAKLMAAYPKITTIRPREEKKRSRKYAGIGLNDEGEQARADQVARQMRAGK